ncbi:MAG TPA: PAS domain-containing sensor histidine kinase [Vicinamibacterales bacterium]|nr:PAS domain-containing sensor histidine kinase [Vicinamibacterales bacterium]
MTPLETFPDAAATFRNLLERISAITYVRLPHDPKRAIHFSPSLETVLGLTPEACAADPGVWIARLHPDDRERVVDEFDRAHATLEPLSSEYRVGDGQGRVRWFRDEGEWVRNQAGHVAWLYGVLIEITDRVVAEQALRRLQRQIATEHQIARQLAETSNLREAGTRLLHALAQLVGADVAALWVPEGDALQAVAVWARDDRTFAPFLQASVTCKLARGEGLPGRVWRNRAATVIANLRLDTNFPRIRSAESVGLTSAIAMPVAVGDEFFGVMEFFGLRPLEPDEDLLTSLSAIGHDIALSARRTIAETEVARLNRDLRHHVADLRQASQLKDEFLATLSHELRTPANAVLGWLRMISAGAVEREDWPRAIAAIERNARAQAQLIDDLLDISRIGSGQMRLDPSTFDLGALLVSLVDGLRPLAESRRIQLEVSVEHDVPMVVGDPRRIQQVAINLLNNALKFTPAGGRVVLRAGRDSAVVEFAVSDTGIGITPEFLPQVFERFRRDSSRGGEPGGLGLGLAIARHLVELHGGTISVESGGPGTGATFRVRLPTSGR